MELKHLNKAELQLIRHALLELIKTTPTGVYSSMDIPSPTWTRKKAAQIAARIWEQL